MDNFVNKLAIGGGKARARLSQSRGAADLHVDSLPRQHPTETEHDLFRVPGFGFGLRLLVLHPFQGIGQLLDPALQRLHLPLVGDTQP